LVVVLLGLLKQQPFLQLLQLLLRFLLLLQKVLQ
jgi:hypothetical protein